MQALSGLIRRPGGFTKSIVAWVTLTVPVCLATTRLVAPCRWPAISPTTASFKSTVVDSRWGRGALTRGSSAGLLVSHRRRHRNPGAVPRCFGRGSRRIEYPPTLVRGCSRDEHSPMSRVFLTHSAAQAVHALRSGRPSAQGGWVKGSCLVREGVPTDRRHAALKQRTTHRLRGTEDER